MQFKNSKEVDYQTVSAPNQMQVLLFGKIFRLLVQITTF